MTTRILTSRQLQVLELSCEGLTAPEISERLSLRPMTVKKHRHEIEVRLGARSIHHAVAIAFDSGLVSPFELGRRSS